MRAVCRFSRLGTTELMVNPVSCVDNGDDEEDEDDDEEERKKEKGEEQEEEPICTAPE